LIVKNIPSWKISETAGALSLVRLPVALPSHVSVAANDSGPSLENSALNR
jgi:hypothetical protein